MSTQRIRAILGSGSDDTGIDLDVVEEIIYRVERFMKKERLSLDPRRKAEFIRLMIEEVMESGDTEIVEQYMTEARPRRGLLRRLLRKE